MTTDGRRSPERSIASSLRRLHFTGERWLLAGGPQDRKELTEVELYADVRGAVHVRTKGRAGVDQEGPGPTFREVSLAGLDQH